MSSGEGNALCKFIRRQKKTLRPLAARIIYERSLANGFHAGRRARRPQSAPAFVPREADGGGGDVGGDSAKLMCWKMQL